jgi:hypothetical protein
MFACAAAKNLWQVATGQGYPVCTGPYAKTQPYLDNGFLELDNNTVERAVKPVAIGRKNWMFAGSERGGPVIV